MKIVEERNRNSICKLEQLEPGDVFRVSGDNSTYLVTDEEDDCKRVCVSMAKGVLLKVHYEKEVIKISECELKIVL